MIQIFKTVADWRQFRSTLSPQNVLGFVPTMGNLHAGHASLLKRSKQDNNKTVLSIFVNPTQFNRPDDFQHYPRTLTEDLQYAKELGVDYVFIPSVEELYSDQYSYQILENKLSLPLEGQSRPGHFNGVLTIVMKLLQLVKPKRAYFGEKDYQQLQLIQGLVKTFFIDTEIIACETMRDPNGLALSSRNRRLSADDYTNALLIPKLLRSPMTCSEITKEFERAGMQVDYVVEQDGRRFAAVSLGDIRLIDNVLLGSSLIKGGF